MKMIKLVAFDLDGTLTQHKTPISDENRAVLDRLAEKSTLLMVGAGQVMRIFNQLEHFPIDIIGNYGLQYAAYNPETKSLDIKRDEVLPCDRESVDKRVTMLREKYGFTEFITDNRRNAVLKSILRVQLLRCLHVKAYTSEIIEQFPIFR